MDKKVPEKYYPLALSLGQLLSVARLYSVDHPAFKEKLNQVFEEIRQQTPGNQSLILSEREGFLLINGEKVETRNSLIERFASSLRGLKLGSLDLEPGLTVEELMILVQLLSLKAHSREEISVKDYLEQKSARHVIPRFATYKLVEENEKIVKEGGILSVEDIPPEIISQFTQDLRKGEVPQKLEKKEKEYLALAHDAKFLSGLAWNTTQEAKSPEEFTKVLWLIGDYLINEISTAKQEELHVKILEDLKKNLFTFWEKKPEQARWKNEIEETFSAISATLELKGLLLLYKKHSKELEGVAKKLSKILETLPPESRIFKKTLEDLKKIGPPSLEKIFPPQ